MQIRRNEQLAKHRKKRATDWPAIVLDLRGAGMSYADIGRATGVRKQTVHAWTLGSQPLHAAGERLLSLWAETIGDRLEVASANEAGPAERA